MDSFRLLHISDVHFADRPERLHVIDHPTRLARARYRSLHRLTSHDPVATMWVADQVAELGSSLDAVVITGDLATDGTPESLLKAFSYVHSQTQKAFFAGLTPALNGELAREGKMSYAMAVVPGNHDRYVVSSRAAYAPGGEVFDRVFRSYWPQAMRVGILAVIERPASGELLAIIGADFSLRSRWDASLRPLHYMGQGRAYKDIVEELSAKTRLLRDELGKVAITWVMHFAPCCPGLPEKLRMSGDADLLDAAIACGVSTILCGHTHRASVYHYPSPMSAKVTICCAGTASQYLSPSGNTIHLYTVSVDAGRVVDIKPETIRYEVGPRRIPRT